MASNIYYRILGQEFGPVSLDFLQQLAAEGHLGAGDEVRVSDGQWKNAGSLPQLFPQRHLEPERSSQTQQPRQKVQAASSPATTRTHISHDAPAATAEASAKSLSPRMPSRCLGPPARGAASKQRKAAKATRRAFAAAGEFLADHPWFMLAAACGLIILAIRHWPPPSHDIEHYRMLESIGHEFEALRAAGATPEAWSEFALAMQERVGPVVTELESTADSQHPARQHLLWAARDYLPQMLSRPRAANNEPAEKFRRQLESAGRYLAIENSAESKQSQSNHQRESKP